MIDAHDYRLIAAVQAGLPITSRPYAMIAGRLGMSEQEVIDRLTRLKSQGLIKRWGVVVKHRPLGYRANAMIVMDVPDSRVAEIGRQIGSYGFVNLCYLRPRQGDAWPYNLYCMIHGKSREKVLAQWAELRTACGLMDLPCEVLFSRRCFKQRGALYTGHEAAENPACGKLSGAGVERGEIGPPKSRIVPGFAVSGISTIAEQNKLTTACSLPAV